MAGKGKHPFRFPARFPGKCTCCGKDFAKGDDVQYTMQNKLVIVGCTGVTGD